MKFQLGQKVKYSKVYKKSGYVRLDECDNTDEPIQFNRQDIKEVPERSGIVCGIRRICITSTADFIDSGNYEYGYDRWEITSREFKQVYLVAHNMAGLDRVSGGWVEELKV